MATSQNGYKVGTKAELGIVNLRVPGTSTILPVRGGDTATVLLWAATRWHNEVEPLVEPGNWGYAARTIRGSETELSNHASGTAIDLNAPKHPLGTSPAKSMTPPQIAAVRRIVADSGGVLRWGGDYTGRQDPMHLEINADPAAVAALVRRLGAQDSGGKFTTGSSPAPSPAAQEDDMFDDTDRQLLTEVRDRLRGSDPNVDMLQRIDQSTADSWKRLRGQHPTLDSLQALAYTQGNTAQGVQQLIGMTVGGNTDGRTNFHWLGDLVTTAVASGTEQVLKAVAGGAQVDPADVRAQIEAASAQLIAKAVADEQDRRARDGDPATGPVS